MRSRRNTQVWVMCEIECKKKVHFFPLLLCCCLQISFVCLFYLRKRETNHLNNYLFCLNFACMCLCQRKECFFFVTRKTRHSISTNSQSTRRSVNNRLSFKIVIQPFLFWERGRATEDCLICLFNTNWIWICIAEMSNGSYCTGHSLQITCVCMCVCVYFYISITFFVFSSSILLQIVFLFFVSTFHSAKI